jgi:hypothetical protein
MQFASGLLAGYEFFSDEDRNGMGFGIKITNR